MVTTTETTTTTEATTTTTVDPTCCQSVEVVLDGSPMEMIAQDDQFVSDSHHMVSLNVYGKDYWVLMRNWHPVFSPSGITVSVPVMNLHFKKLPRSTVSLQPKRTVPVTPNGTVTQRHLQQSTLTVHPSSHLFNINALLKISLAEKRVFLEIVSLVVRIEQQLRPTRDESAFSQATLKVQDTFRM